MFGFGILTGLTFLPMVGVAFLLTQRGEDAATLRNIRWATLLTTLEGFVAASFGESEPEVKAEDAQPALEPVAEETSTYATEETPPPAPSETMSLETPAEGSVPAEETKPEEKKAETPTAGCSWRFSPTPARSRATAMPRARKGSVLAAVRLYTVTACPESCSRSATAPPSRPTPNTATRISSP